MNVVDRIIHSINWLARKEAGSINKLSDQQRKQVQKIYLEDFSVNPDRQINKMCAFLDTQLSSFSPTAFKKLGIPATYYRAEYNRKLAKIKAEAGAKSVELLMEMAEVYERDFRKSCGAAFDQVLM